MASIIRVKRSTGTNIPATLQWGELAYVTGIGSYGGLNQYKDRVFIGDDGSNVLAIGGRYYTSMMEHSPGNLTGVTNTRNSDGGIVAVLDSNRKIDEWNVDNLKLDTNILSSTNTNGDIIIDPNGTGNFIFTGGTSQKFRINDGTIDRFTVDSITGSVDYNQGTLTSNAPVVESWATWNNAGIAFTGIIFNATNTASANGSSLLRLIANGQDVFSVGVNGITTTTGIGTVVSGNGGSGNFFVQNLLSAQTTTTQNLNVLSSFNLIGITSFTGRINQTGLFFNQGGAVIDNVAISSNVISTKSGAGNQLFIDPYPDGLSNQGTVIIKGDLQVDGTTITVNSTNATVNEPVLKLGDVTTERVVMSPALAGVNTIRLDSVIGLNISDVVSGSTALSAQGLSTITSVDSTNQIITIQNNLAVGGITTTSKLTITTGYDTNTDRGIAYSYNTGAGGTTGNKTGFFGYKDSSGYWTYIPDATNTNSVISGVKGTLDVGAIYLDWAVSGIHTRGALYFNSAGKIISTNEPEVGYATTSNYVLTTDASNVPVWTNTLDGGTF
jgi:hypothetical protein